MPNIAIALREEINRLAAKQVRFGMTKVKQDTVRLKRDVARLKRQVAMLQREKTFLVKQVARTSEVTAPPVEKLQKMRVTGKWMISLRKRLDLTQADFGKLMGVSGQQVYQYERKTGVLRLRETTKAALAKVRQMGKREARKALEAQPVAKAPQKKRRAKKARLTKVKQVRRKAKKASKK
ncbi:MAG: helix-turn-helix transcriptional regulator [Planctomycetaceae bacterium]|nr:helix-turn-helix domain-containing protein [Planctomycetaceae bacterium]